MILTHLVLFEFVPGCTATAAASGFAGTLGMLPWAFFDGFTAEEAAAVTAEWVVTFRRRRH
jgi:hypothetical protein